MRMPASMDLLEMLHEYFDEVLDSPIEAQEVDSAFDLSNLGRNSLITIHFLRRKSSKHLNADSN